MPKESVFGEQMFVNTNPDGSHIDRPQVPMVDVRWGREQEFVQVVTKVESPDGGRWAGDDPETHYTDGYYVNLNRTQINDLIRKLRRARDQAFGRDE